jgi:hypothetical protein
MAAANPLTKAYDGEVGNEVGPPLRRSRFNAFADKTPLKVQCSTERDEVICGLPHSQWHREWLLPALPPQT